LGLTLISFVLGCLLVGCGTPTADWNSRIGHYTLTQANTDLGAPSKSKSLPDGGTSAEWLTHPGTAMPTYTGMETGPRAGGVDQPVVTGAAVQTRNEYLHLTFDSSGTLTKWEHVYR